MKLREKTTAILLVAVLMLSAMTLAIPLTSAKKSLPNPTSVSLSFTEKAVSVILGDGTQSGGWTDNYPDLFNKVPMIDFIKTGKAYHRADGMWFNVWLYKWGLEITANSPITISNGRFACWTEYIGLKGLPIKDHFRGELIIYYDETQEGWTMEGEYTQYSYFFGSEEVVLKQYPKAVQVDDSDKWLLRTVVYEVTPYSCDWILDFIVGGEHYIHDMKITDSVFEEGVVSFSGTGGYPSGAEYSTTWAVIGTVSEEIAFTIVYDDTIYTVWATGTITAEGMEGTAETSIGQEATWIAYQP